MDIPISEFIDVWPPCGAIGTAAATPFPKLIESGIPALRHLSENAVSDP